MFLMVSFVRYVQITVRSELQMGEMTPTPTEQQVPIDILKRLDANQLQQL